MISSFITSERYVLVCRAMFPWLVGVRLSGGTGPLQQSGQRERSPPAPDVLQHRISSSSTPLPRGSQVGPSKCPKSPKRLSHTRYIALEIKLSVKFGLRPWASVGAVSLWIPKTSDFPSQTPLKFEKSVRLTCIIGSSETILYL